MKISVLGCGRWGSFIGWYLANNGHQVVQWGTEGNYSFDVLKNTGRNEYVELDKRIYLTSDLKQAIEVSEVIIISISAQGLRGFMSRINQYNVKNKTANTPVELRITSTRQHNVKYQDCQQDTKHTNKLKHRRC